MNIYPLSLGAMLWMSEFWLIFPSWTALMWHKSSHTKRQKSVPPVTLQELFQISERDTSSL